MTYKSPRAAALLAIALASFNAAGAADDKQSAEELRNTVVNVLEGLVQKGVITREQAEAMVAEAKAKAAADAQQRAAQEASEQNAVRVNSVPEIVRQQIRDELRAEMHDEVVNDVIASAKKEGWGVPGALPEWAKYVKLYGDVRARYEVDWYANDNFKNAYLDINAVNAAGSVFDAGTDAVLNVSEDRRRLVGRLRLGLSADLGGDFGLDMRLTSGNTRSPVSTNQTLGNYNGRWSVVVDRAAVLWHPINEKKSQEFDLRFGRFSNPFVGLNELIWDADLTFEGIAATYAYDLFGRDAKKMERGLFLTLGAFPLQEVELSSDDKYLYGAQLGVEVGLGSESRLRIAGGYFDFDNVTGVANPAIGLTDNDFTAPAFVQKGNTLFDINPDGTKELFALAGEYRLANASMLLDLGFGATHAMIGGEYVKNIGWKSEDVRARSSGSIYTLSQDPFAESVAGYEYGVIVGRPTLNALGHWRASLFYKYVERDAVLDAFTDSDFRLGGTDAKGYQVSFDFGLSRGAWLKLRYLTADEIDSLPLGIDVLQLDINGQF